MKNLHCLNPVLSVWRDFDMREAWLLRVKQYLRYLEKGQIPPESISLTAFERDLMLDNDKYSVLVTRTAVNSLRVELNGTHVDVVFRKLSDGGLLLQVDGSSALVHAEEESVGTRLTINNLTCLLSNEHDLSCLTASSPGKLVRCAVAYLSHDCAADCAGQVTSSEVFEFFFWSFSKFNSFIVGFFDPINIFLDSKDK